MKIDFRGFGDGLPLSRHASGLEAFAASETDRLTDVIVCAPDNLAPVPCCAVTRASLASGFACSTWRAAAQHAALLSLLESRGVRCHRLDPVPGLPDLCFTRDIGCATPFGLVALNPAMPHRRGEIAALTSACARWSVPLRAIDAGTLEGGDICIAREGLLIARMSGERSTLAGIEQFAEPFRRAGWDVLICPFDSDYLHLDTIFCMVDRNEAIACTELLDPVFVAAVAARGIRILPVPARAAASLGCNILALGGRHIVASTGDAGVTHVLAQAGYRVDLVDISEFAACGGGIHCLTQPLRRTPG